MTDARAVQRHVDDSLSRLRTITVGVLAFVVLVTVATLVVILMAVVPGWPINQQGERQTARAVADINEVSVLGAYCAHQHQSLTEIRVCVAQGLAELKEQNP